MEQSVEQGAVFFFILPGYHFGETLAKIIKSENSYLTFPSAHPTNYLFNLFLVFHFVLWESCLMHNT